MTPAGRDGLPTETDTGKGDDMAKAKEEPQEEARRYVTPFIGADGNPVTVSESEALDLRRQGVSIEGLELEDEAGAIDATITEGGAA